MIQLIIVLLFVIGFIVKVILESKQGSTYSKNLTPTMRFILAAGANTAQAADCGRVDIGGNPANNWAKKHMRKLLKSGWGVRNAEDLKQTIHWLFNGGHNEECMEIYNQYKLNQEPVRNKKMSKNNKDIVFSKISESYEKQGILAWDLCRICNVAGWGFLAEYITYEEAIEISVQACKLLQENYSSWDDMMESYFLGLLYWNNEFYVTKNRRECYEASKKNKDSIYNISWDTILSPDDVIPPRTK